jgi:hypothetical protein
LASPIASLATNAAGHVDFLDSAGRWVGTGPAIPSEAGFVRRWRVSPLPGASDVLVIEVVVAPVTDRQWAADPVRQDDVRIVTMKGRKAW